MGRQGSRTHFIDIDDGDLATVFTSPVHTPAAFSSLPRTPAAFSSPPHAPAASPNPPHTPTALPSPGLPCTPAADLVESDPLAQEPHGIIPDPNPAPKAGARSNSKILHRALNGERLFAITHQSISNILQLHLVMKTESLSGR